MGMLKNLKCKCGNTHKEYGGRLDIEGNFTCEICCKEKLKMNYLKGKDKRGRND